MANGFADFLSGNQFDYLLDPLSQYQRFYQQQLQPVAGRELSPYARAAAGRAYQPNYLMYSGYEEPLGTYGTFADYLTANRPASGSMRDMAVPTAANIFDLAQRVGMGRDNTAGTIGAITEQIDPVRYQYYYGGEDAMENQMRLAQLDALARTGGKEVGARAAYNPALYQAAQGAIENMYSNYLGTGKSGFGTYGPTGFMQYYLNRRRPRGNALGAGADTNAAGFGFADAANVPLPGAAI